MPQRSANNRLELREEAKAYYRDKKNIEAKWLDQYGNISLEDDYQRNRSCLSEIFNMLDVVMENCIDDFRKTHVLVSADPVGPRTVNYTFEGDDGKTAEFRTPSTFASRATALRAIGYTISNELFYDTRLLRNETTHGNRTIVLQHMQLSYADTMKAMLSMADTLIELGVLDPSLRIPPFERLRVREKETLSNGAYTIEYLIGEGGMSRVYAATQTRIGRRIAIKELKPETYSEDLIRNECDTLLRLHHDLIPQIHDVFYENATWYIAMSYVEGQTLDRYVAEKAPVAPAARQTICRSLLDILRYLHSPEVQIVFTDLAPDNIIIDKNNLPHLIDFGISSQIETRQALPAATLGYSAPEVFTNSILDQRSDIYSFGCILRFLYTGLSPLEKSEQPTKELVSDPRIADIINRCTAKNRAERYASVEDLKNDLFPEKLPAEKAGSSRRPLVAAGAIAVAAAAVGLGIFANSRNHRQEETASVSEEISISSEALSEALSESIPESSSENLAESSAESSSESLAASSAETAAESAVESSSENVEESTSESISENTEEAEKPEESTDVWPDVPEPPTKPAPTPVVFPPSTTFASSGLSDHAMDWRDENLEMRMRELTGITEGDIMLSDVWDIQEFDLTDSGVTDVSALAELTQLTALYLSGNPIDINTLSSMSTLPDLMILDLNACDLTDISFLRAFSSLQELYLGHNSITDLSPLKEYSRLTTLELQYNPVGDDPDNLKVISGLSNLTWLDMKECNLSDLRFLMSLPYLMNTDLSNNQITDLTPLRYTTLLEYLDVSSNAVTDLRPLSDLTNLYLFHAFHNDISGDLNALTNLTQLTDLDLHKNRITDISALKNLTSLEILDLEDNEITDFSVLDGMQFEELYT